MHPLWAQIAVEKHDWQEQILEMVDEEEFTEEQYARLIEMLDDLSYHDTDSLSVFYRFLHHDSVPGPFSFRNRQQLIVHTDRCLNTRAGYRNPSPERQASGKAYLGDPWHHTLRYALERSDRNRRHQWRAGLTLDKDAGEAWLHRLPFADSFSLFAAYRSQQGWLRQAIVGHYRLQLGNGLLLNQQFTLGKNFMGSELARQAPRLSPHSSAAESGYMQGAAACLRWGEHFECLPFVSVQQIDGSLKKDTLSSWATDGYHRTRNEDDKRHSVWLTNCGLRTQAMGEWWEIGANLLYSQFSHTYFRPLRTYNRNYFRGHQLLQGSLDYRVLLFGCHLRGEAAIDDGGGWAWLNALGCPLGNSWKLSAIHRYYSDKYRQIWGAAMAESSAMQGEQGATLQVEGVPWRHWNVQASADWWRFYQPQYGIDQPSRGFEVSTRLVWQSHIGRNLRMPATASFRYRIKQKEKNNTLTERQGDLTAYFRHTLDATLQIEPYRGIALRTQAHCRLYSAANTGGLLSGYAFSEALIVNHSTFPLRGELQAAWFRTDSYDTRLYLTERNLLYGFGQPMLYGEGFRYSATLSYKISERIQAEAKYASTNYKDKSSVGSGLQSIEGNMKHDLWMQIRVKF